MAKLIVPMLQTHSVASDFSVKYPAQAQFNSYLTAGMYSIPLNCNVSSLTRQRSSAPS